MDRVVGSKPDLRQVAEVVVSAGVAAVLTMGYIVLVGRIVGPEEYADFAAALSVIYFIGVALSPVGPAVSRLCARFTARGDHHAVAALRRQAIIRMAATAGLVGIAGAAASPFLARALEFRSFVPLALVFAVVLVFAVLNVDRGVVQGLLEFRVHNVNIVLEALVRWTFAIMVLLGWRSAGAGIASYLVAMLAAEAMLAVRFRRDRTTTRATVDWNEVRRVTMPLAVLMIAIATMQNVDMLVVKRYFAPAESGAYGAASALARAIGIVFVPLYVMLTPILTALRESGRPVHGATLRFGVLFLALSVVPLILFALWPELIVTTLYGQEFRPAAPLLAPLAGVAIVLYVSLMLSQALITLEKNRFLIAYSVLTVVQIAALVMFHHTFGEVLQALYAVQCAGLVIIATFFILSWRAPRRQPC